MAVNSSPAIVVFGDVIHSRLDPAGSSAWLRSLCAELQAAYGKQALAAFGFTQGDELQGLLQPSADPLGLILRAALSHDARPMRWAIAVGAVEPGAVPRPNGPARRSSWPGPRSRRPAASTRACGS